MRSTATEMAAVIWVEAIRLATEPLNMRAGNETALARLGAMFSLTRPHHAYCFANRRAKGMKMVLHDGIGVWLAARRLNRGKFTWTKAIHGPHMSLEDGQWQAPALGLPWPHVRATGATSMLWRTTILQTLIPPLPTLRHTGGHESRWVPQP